MPAWLQIHFASERSPDVLLEDLDELELDELLEELELELLELELEELLELELELELDELGGQGPTKPLSDSTKMADSSSMTQPTSLTPCPAGGVTVMLTSDSSS
jgi:hypothetical protein